MERLPVVQWKLLGLAAVAVALGGGGFVAYTEEDDDPLLLPLPAERGR